MKNYQEKYYGSIAKELEKANGHLYCGNMISASKSGYRKKYPDNEVYFNANIFIIENEKLIKVWWGDLDITKYGKDLQKVADICQFSLFILSEFDGRFSGELNIDNVNQIAKKIVKFAPL